MVQAGAICPLRGVALDLVDVPQRITMSQCALVPVGSKPRHLDLRFLPEDPSRPPPGDGRGKGEAGVAGPARASPRRTLAAAVASAAPRTPNSTLCSLKLCEQHFIGRVASATRLVGQVCMLVAVRHIERRRIITEPERRRPRLPNRPAAWVRTDAPWRSRHAPCQCGCWSNAFGCWGDVATAQGRERHGVRKPRDGLPTRCTRRTRRVAGADR
jgi:hypothetical protein